MKCYIMRLELRQWTLEDYNLMQVTKAKNMLKRKVYLGNLMNV